MKHGAFQAPGVPAEHAMEVMTGGEDQHWWHVAKRRLVRGYLDTSLPPGRCLDIGCGGGAMLAEAAELGPVVGMDLSVTALQRARDRGISTLVMSEAAAVPLATGSCATVLALDVIEHHARPEALLGEIHRVLVPGGRLIVTVPAFDWMWSYADDVLGHYRRYTLRELRAELKASGFEVARVSYFHAWLLPVAWVFRKLRALARQTKAADDFAVPGALNRVLLALCGLERRLLGRRDLRFGLSLLAVGTKPLAPAEAMAPADASHEREARRPSLAPSLDSVQARV
jgi:SAM-dependent methyltransferase